jgi:hypothetical protein
LIEYVHSLKELPTVAIAMFSLYFPRFEKYMDNKLSLIRACILKSNLIRIKQIDDLVKNLVRNRYTNLNEYKHKIHSGQDLPNYLKTLLIDNKFYLTETVTLQQPQRTKSPKWSSAAAYTDNVSSFTRTTTTENNDRVLWLQ